ncbi:MAG: hypothetical protein U5R31_09300 [Acidimicrobiia bacterium]|nr:hypothetical protein [Acidimicrobiia bacterium]
MLDLDFSDEQDMLRDAVRGVCEHHALPAEIRTQLEDDRRGFSASSCGSSWRSST